MTVHPERYVGLGFVILLAAVLVPPAAEGWPVSGVVPPPASAFEQRFPGDRLFWVEARTEGGQAVYDLYARRGQGRYVLCVSPDGEIVRPARCVGLRDRPESPDGVVGEAGGAAGQ